MPRTAFAFFLLVCCLAASLLGAPLADIQRTPLEDNEVVEIREMKEETPKISGKLLLPLDDLEDAVDERNGRQLEIGAVGENRLLGGLLGTVLALPGSLAAGVEGLLNGVVSGLLGGRRIVDVDLKV